MTYGTYQALVVDDEVLVRRLTIRALRDEGFACDAAADGAEAWEMLRSNRYDVVVTDLRMPNRHGHSLAVELLASADHPIVVILTGVLEPKLAKDLLTRGAECVEFKPVDYRLFAAKICALADRRLLHAQERNANDEESPAKQELRKPSDPSPCSLSDIERRLTQLSKVLPISQAAFDVFNMASSNVFDAQQIGAAIARDASLSVDVLRMANSAFYNNLGEKIIELAEAVTRVGQKRIGELALATSALTALTANVLPWLNVDLAWRRSMAAGVAVELLLDHGGHAELEEALFLSALMHPLGRIALGMLYPHPYQEMIRACEAQNETLLEHEKRLFPLSHAEVMARLLEAWGVPAGIYEPLRYTTHSYPSLAKLSETLRVKTELVKLAVLIGRIAVGQWEPWDQVEFPPEQVGSRLSVDSLSTIIADTKSDLETIVSIRLRQFKGKEPGQNPGESQPPAPQLPYCNLSPEPFDFLAEIVPSMGIQLKPCGAEIFESEENVLVNCIGTRAYRLAVLLNARPSPAAKLLVADADNLEPYRRFGQAFSLPGSYGALRLACEELAQKLGKDLLAARV